MTYVEKMYDFYTCRTQERAGLAASIAELNTMIDALSTERDTKIEQLKGAEHRKERDERNQAVFRLMNDIRLGKIIPVVAENGTIASVTFS